MKTITQWSVTFLIRVLLAIIGIIRLPFAILSEAFEHIAEWLEDIQNDLRHSYAWPWIAEFRAKWEESSHAERERLLANLRRVE
jgi:hypothetical protein